MHGLLTHMQVTRTPMFHPCILAEQRSSNGCEVRTTYLTSSGIRENFMISRTRPERACSIAGQSGYGTLSSAKCRPLPTSEAVQGAIPVETRIHQYINTSRLLSKEEVYAATVRAVVSGRMGPGRVYLVSPSGGTSNRNWRNFRNRHRCLGSSDPGRDGYRNQ